MAKAPDGFMPLFLTGASQELFGCKCDEQVTAEKPMKLITIDLIRKDMQERAAVSDFSTCKAEMLSYKGVEVLIVYDVDFKYGSNFILALSEAAKNRYIEEDTAKIAVSAAATPTVAVGKDGQIIESVVEEPDDEPVVVVVPKPHSPWTLTCEKEIQEASAIPSRPPIRLLFSRRRRYFGAPMNLNDSNKDASLRIEFLNSVPPVNNADLEKKVEEKPLYRHCIMHTGIQAVPVQASQASQTSRLPAKNAIVQYTARTLDSGTDTGSSTEMDSAFQTMTTEVKKLLRGANAMMERALIENRLLNVFIDEYSHLRNPGEVPVIGHKDKGKLKEFQSFANPDTKGVPETVRAIAWNTTLYGVLAIACGAKRSFYDRITMSCKAVKSFVHIWALSDPLKAQLILSAPDDIFCVKFCPTNPFVLAGGCANGQVVIWDLTVHSKKLEHAAERSRHTSANKTINKIVSKHLDMQESVSQQHLDDDEEEDHPTDDFTHMTDAQKQDNTAPIVVPAMLTSIDHGHRCAITDLLWLPKGTDSISDIEISKSGRMVESTTTEAYQLLTCAADGTAFFWDIRSIPTSVVSDKDKNVATPNTPVPLKVLLKQADLVLRPLLKVGVVNEALTLDDGLTTFCINSTQHVINIANRALRELKENKAMASIAAVPTEPTSKFFLGTERGYLTFLDWKPPESDSGKLGVQTIDAFVQGHKGAIRSIRRSPFFPDIILTVGGNSVCIWTEKPNFNTKPLVEAFNPGGEMTAGEWSPTRPGVFFVARNNGSIDLWDLADSSSKPSLNTMISSPIALTCLLALECSRTTTTDRRGRENFLCVGDDAGKTCVLEIPPSFYVPISNEAVIIKKLFEVEEARIQYTLDRAVSRSMNTNTNRNEPVKAVDDHAQNRDILKKMIDTFKADEMKFLADMDLIKKAEKDDD